MDRHYQAKIATLQDEKQRLRTEMAHARTRLQWVSFSRHNRPDKALRVDAFHYTEEWGPVVIGEPIPGARGRLSARGDTWRDFEIHLPADIYLGYHWHPWIEELTVHQGEVILYLHERPLSVITGLEHVVIPPRLIHAAVTRTEVHWTVRCHY